jgi:3-oxoacyl-[acyl-carrier protein] reductase
MNLDLKGKNAWVGGSSKGIGWSTAVELAKMGANVTLIGRRETILKEKIKELQTNENQIHDYVVIDYQNTADLVHIINKKVQEKEYTIVINNTGGPAGGEIAMETPEKFEMVLKQHLLANQVILQAVLPAMKNKNFGRIVNILSVSVKQPIIGLGVSNTTRYAVAA